MPLALADLLDAPTPQRARDYLYSLLALGGFPTTSWQPGSVPRRFAEAKATIYADALGLVSRIAAGGYLDLATGDWLTLLARSAYGLERNAAVSAQGPAALRDAGGAGPFTIAPFTLWATSTSGKRFQNITGGLLPQGGALALTWQAEGPGSAYNIASGTLTTLSTTLPGVTVTNAAPGAWLTQSGSDAESDDSLRLRCRARWPSLGSGATALVYDAWARTASPEVQKVKVLENVTGAGRVSIVVAGAAGPASAPAVQAVRDYIAPRRPLTVAVDVDTATPRTVPVAATLTVQAAYQTVANANAQAALTTYQNALGIGDSVLRAVLIEKLMELPGAVNVALASPPYDTALTRIEIALLTPSFTVVGA